MEAAEMLTLNPQDLEDLLYCRMPEEQWERQIRELTPLKCDRQTFLNLLTQLQEEQSVEINIRNGALDCTGCYLPPPDGSDTYLAVALLLAAGGVKVAKFLPWAKPSALLEHLGLARDLKPKILERLYADCGLMLMPLSRFFPEMANFVIRWERLLAHEPLAFDSLFAYALPLLNPVEPRYRLYNVPSPLMALPMGEYLAEYSRTEKALIIRGDEETEVAVAGKTHLFEITGRELRKNVLQTTFDAEVSEMDFREAFDRLVAGESLDSLLAWRVAVNAGMGFYLADKAPTMSEGMVMANKLLAEKRLAEFLEHYRGRLGNVKSG